MSEVTEQKLINLRLEEEAAKIRWQPFTIRHLVSCITSDLA